MLQRIRDRVTAGPFAIVVLALIAISFGFFGVVDYNFLTAGNAAKVEDSEISLFQLENAYQNQLLELSDFGSLPAQTRRERIFALSEEYGAGALDLMPVLRREIFAGTVDITVCYCSVYEECWTTRLQDLVQRSRDGERPTGAQAVARCEATTQSGI